MRKLILIALAFVTLQAAAQANQKEHRKAKAEQMKLMSAEDQATIAMKKLTLSLDLDEKQQSQVKEIMLEQATNRKQKMAQKTEMKEVRETKSNAKAYNVKEINERLDKKIEVKQKMKTILNPEQYKKWEGMLERLGEKEKKRMKTKHKN